MLSFINRPSAAPFKACLNVLQGQLKLWTLTKLRTYGGVAAFDLICWHQQLAIISQIKPTALLTEHFWHQSEEAFLFVKPKALYRLPFYYTALHKIFFLCDISSPHFQFNMSIIFSWLHNRWFMRRSHSAQTAIKFLSVALNVVSILSLMGAIALLCTLSNGS